MPATPQSVSGASLLLLSSLQRLSCLPYQSVRKGHILVEPFSQGLFVFLQKLDVLGYLDLPAFWRLPLPPVLQELKSYYHVEVGVLEGSTCVLKRRAGLVHKLLYGLDRVPKPEDLRQGFTFYHARVSSEGSESLVSTSQFVLS